jgi:autotransporter translocation and assembly factor TamB
MRWPKAWIIGVLALLGAGAWWMQRSPWLSSSLRAPIAQALSTASGRSVSIGGVGGGLSGWIWLHQVGVGPRPGRAALDLSFTAAALGLKLDAWALLTGRADLRSLRAVQVEAPSVFVLRAAEPAGPGAGGAAPVPPELMGASSRAVRAAVQALGVSAGAQAGAVSAAAQALAKQDWRELLEHLPLPPVRIDLVQGEAWIQRDGQAAHPLIHDVRLRIEPAPQGGFRVEGAGRPDGGGLVNVSGGCGPAFSGLFLVARLKDLGWIPWMPLPGGLGALRGRLSGALEARPVEGAWPDGIDLKGEGSVEDAALQPSGGRPGCAGLKAQWSLRSAQAQVDGLEAAYAGGRISGRAGLDLRSMVFSATLTAQAADLGVLALSAGAPPNLGLQGTADADFWAAGPVSAPAMALEFSSRAAQWQGHPLTKVELEASGGGSQWSGDGSLAWDKGQGTLSLDISRGNLEEASLKVSALPADWLKAWAGPGMDGRLDGEASYSQEESAWELALSGAHLTVRGNAVDHASLTASGDGRDAHLRVEADLPARTGLNGEADALRGKDGVWSLSSARLYQKKRLLLQASGQWRPGGADQADALSLTVETEPLDLAFLAGGSAPQGWSGAVQADGQLTLDQGAWRGELHASSPSLSRKGWALPGSASVYFSPEGVTLSSLACRHGELKGDAYAPGWQGPWSADLSLHKAWLPALAALSDDAPRDLSGRASGTLSYVAAPRPRFTASLDCEDPLPRALPETSGHLDLRAEGPLWDLQAIALVQAAGGTLKGQGSLDLSGRAAWKGQLDLDHMVLQGLTLTGTLRLAGGAGAPGRLSVDPWSVSATAMPALDASFIFEEGALAAVEGRLGRSRVAARRGEGVWAGRADLNGADPGPLMALWLGRGGATDLKLDGSIEASYASLSAPAYVQLSLRDMDSEESALRARCTWNPGGPSVEASFKGLDLDHLAAAGTAMGLDLPKLKGRAKGAAHGSLQSLSFTASVEALGLGAHGFGPASVEGQWSPGCLRISEAVVGTDSPSLDLKDAVWQSGSNGWSASGDLVAGGWPLAVCTLGLDAGLKASGNRGHVQVEALCRQLQVGVRRWTNFPLSAGWDNGRFSLQQRGRSPQFTATGGVGKGAFTLDMQARSGRGRGTLKGRVDPDGNLDFDGTANGMAAADLAGMMDWEQDWSGAAYGTLKVSGRLDHAHTVVSAKVEDGSVQGLPFDLGTAYVVADGDWVDLSPVTPIRISSRNGTALEVGGKVTLLDNPPPGKGMDVWAELKDGGLRLFQGIPAIQKADGSMVLKLRFTGKPADPRVDGSISVTDGSITPAYLLPRLEHVDVFAQIDDSRLVLHQAKARVVNDGPLVRVETADPRRPAFVFEHWVPAEMNLRFRDSGSGIDLVNTSALRFIQGTAHTDIVMNGSWDEPLVSGKVSLDKGRRTEAVVEWPAQFQPAPKPGETGWFDHVVYHLLVKARSDVMVRTDAAQVFVDTGDAGILVQGAGDAKTVQGHLKLTQGSVDYLLASFRLAGDRETWLDLRGDAEPELELWGVKDLGLVQLAGEGAPRNVQVQLHAWGPLGQVQMQLVGDDPSLSQDQLAQLLGLGTTGGDSPSQGGFTRMLGKVPAAFLTKLARKTGLLDEVGLSSPAVDQAIAPTPEAGDSGQVVAQAQVQPTATTGTARSLAELTMGKYLGSKWFVGVNTDVVERTDPLGRSTNDVQFGGQVDYQLPGSSRLSLQRNVDNVGQTDDRVMVEGSARFDNYNPRRRRWDLPDTPTPSPSPSPQPSPQASATPSQTPLSGPNS